MAQFIVGVIRNVLRHIRVQILESEDIGWVASLRAAKFSVLSPQIGLDDFGGRKKLQNRRVPRGKLLRASALSSLRHTFGCQERASGHRSAGHAETLQERAAPDHALPLKINFFAG